MSRRRLKIEPSRSVGSRGALTFPEKPAGLPSVGFSLFTSKTVPAVNHRSRVLASDGRRMDSILASTITGLLSGSHQGVLRVTRLPQASNPAQRFLANEDRSSASSSLGALHRRNTHAEDIRDPARSEESPPKAPAGEECACSQVYGRTSSPRLHSLREDAGRDAGQAPRVLCPNPGKHRVEACRHIGRAPMRPSRRRSHRRGRLRGRPGGARQKPHEPLD